MLLKFEISKIQTHVTRIPISRYNQFEKDKFEIIIVQKVSNYESIIVGKYYY